MGRIPGDLEIGFAGQFDGAIRTGKSDGIAEDGGVVEPDPGAVREDGAANCPARGVLRLLYAEGERLRVSPIFFSLL
jgi:hypothetical protein